MSKGWRRIPAGVADRGKLPPYQSFDEGCAALVNAVKV